MRTLERLPDSDAAPDGSRSVARTIDAGRSGPARLRPTVTQTADAVNLQRKVGNAAVGSLVRAGLPIQAKLVLGQPGDQYEREADRVAAAVMRSTDAPAPVSLSWSPPTARRLCTECEEERPHDCPDCTAELDGAMQTSSVPGEPPLLTPAVESYIGRSRGAGRPLDRSTRDLFEPRLGHDLSIVRVHDDAAAADSARAISAHAYTVGSDIFFGAGKYSPATNGGRGLLAHELVHTVQQGAAGAGKVSRATLGVVQRLCSESPIPPMAVNVPAVWPIWRLAEECVQETYAATHPGSKKGVSLGFNLGWRWLTGKDTAEREALKCLRPNFTAKSGMHAGEPDIWDLANGTMYEITTRNGASFRRGKLASEVALANKITAPNECGGLFFSAGDWVPPAPCYSIGPNLYMRVSNSGGVLVYDVLAATPPPVPVPHAKGAEEKKPVLPYEALPWLAVPAAGAAAAAAGKALAPAAGAAAAQGGFVTMGALGAFAGVGLAAAATGVVYALISKHTFGAIVPGFVRLGLTDVYENLSAASAKIEQWYPKVGEILATHDTEGDEGARAAARTQLNGVLRPLHEGVHEAELALVGAARRFQAIRERIERTGGLPTLMFPNLMEKGGYPPTTSDALAELARFMLTDADALVVPMRTLVTEYEAIVADQSRHVMQAE